MARLILIETAASMLSTAIVEDGRIICSLESDEPRSQAAMTAPFVKQMLDQVGLKARDCDAVCVSKGPGSYTGLRVGVSTAKGIAFGAGIPLIGIGTLDILVQQGITAAQTILAPQGAREGSFEYIVPLIDARRMEVYTAVYDGTGKRLTEVAPRIIDSQSFASEIGSSATVLFIGDAADKCREPLDREGARFLQTFPKASAMAPLATAAYEKKQFEDVAYFEPFYLKDFIATVSRKKLF
ncbi:MAG: tRNA (adenosine(37)-N6)-threonylcarbamoyltransferase complex dimerization subunit type 1 TsaB [Bacteroidales bacterium]|nr:tRNA (adenosine(37)-N6)-threonylcarbamoyltransferase complex dimerization subunit type 1 TsaB [Bacteroidales bacterium]